MGELRSGGEIFAGSILQIEPLVVSLIMQNIWFSHMTEPARRKLFRLDVVYHKCYTCFQRR